MRNCLGVKYIHNGTVECPFKDICARALKLDHSSTYFDVMPYDFLDNYCAEFVWDGLFKKIIKKKRIPY